MLVKEVDEKREQVLLLCRQFRVKQLDVFGSAATDRFNATTSDLDFLVIFEDMSPREHADAYFGLLGKLEELFGRHVDLVELKAVNNPYFRQALEETRTALYAA